MQCGKNYLVGKCECRPLCDRSYGSLEVHHPCGTDGCGGSCGSCLDAGSKCFNEWRCVSSDSFDDSTLGPVVDDPKHGPVILQMSYLKPTLDSPNVDTPNLFLHATLLSP